MTRGFAVNGCELMFMTRKHGGHGVLLLIN